MKERLIGLIKTYILFVCIFILQKPLFILYYSSLYAGNYWTDHFKIIWNGLPLDLSLAGYLKMCIRDRDLAQKMHISYDPYQFFAEAHPKLKPVETNTAGIFLAGACQAPKDPMTPRGTPLTIT